MSNQKPAGKAKPEKAATGTTGTVSAGTTVKKTLKKGYAEDGSRGKTENQGKKLPTGKKLQKTEKSPVKIAFLGGLNEIGKNMTVYECNGEMIIVDCGIAFPDDEMLGIDLVIPDFTYIEKNKAKIKGIILTHGHEDHIGALPYLMKHLNVPIFGTRLTLGLVECKLREHNLHGRANLNVVKPGQAVGLGVMTVEFIKVNHSIPDAVSLAIHTPGGVIVQTGDFKIDTTPIEGGIIDLGRFAELGKHKVLCLLSDSTNAERAGYSMSERTVGDSFNRLFQTPSAMSKRIIIATFSSNIHRIQQIIDYAAKSGRKVIVSGRSMVNTVSIAKELGYLNVPENILVDLQAIKSYPKEKTIIVTTGSQGEAMSALSRMASADHRQIEVGPDDFIVISATPIPGNEKTVSNVVNSLLAKGCEVVYEKMYDVHVSGHACQEELKIMMGLISPRYFIPVHGEQRHLKKHASLARSMGINKEHIAIAEIGELIEVSKAEMKRLGKVPAGKVFVDGLGVGDVGNIVLRERKHLGQDGLIIVSAAIDRDGGYLVKKPEIVTRGFVYVNEAQSLIENTQKFVGNIIEQCLSHERWDLTYIRSAVKDELSKMIYELNKRTPMILPIIIEV